MRHAVAAVGVLYGVAHFVAQGKGWEYHLYPLAAFALVLPTAEIAPALAAPAAPSRTAAPAERGADADRVERQGEAVSPAGWERAKADVARRLADELAPRLRPGDTVQVLDTTGGGIHALLRLGVREPTRFLYDFHFFHDDAQPAIRALRAELIRGLDARPPRLIVMFEQGWPAGGWERIERFPELGQRLARYDLVRPGPGYRIYAQRRPLSASSAPTTIRSSAPTAGRASASCASASSTRSASTCPRPARCSTSAAASGCSRCTTPPPGRAASCAGST